jgi:WD40 repeat protein
MAAHSRLFRLFVSSTFKDMVAERNALQTRVFPQLREFCAKHRASFQAVDLRWGISEAAGQDQRTVEICLNEIKRSQEQTRRPNFLLLLGNRYGWQPLPVSIPDAEWREILPHIPHDEQLVLKQWYIRDDNAVPPAYILQVRGSTPNWGSIENRLRTALQGAVKQTTLSTKQRIKYETSATEQEIHAGIFNAEGGQENAIIFMRHIEGLPPDEDTYYEDDQEAQAKLAALKARLTEENVHRITAQYADGGLSEEYLQDFCDRVHKTLEAAIKAELEQIQDLSPLEEEIMQHEAFRYDRSQHFIGREDVLQAVAAHLQKQTDHALVIHGPSGVGKTSIMAQVIQQYPQALYRFIGATPDSTTIQSLLTSLCQEIAARTGIQDEIPSDYNKLVEAFPQFLGSASPEQPLLIILDALDQLSTFNNPANLRWFPTQLPPYVQMVVSVIPGNYLNALRQKLAASAFCPVQPMSRDLAEKLLDTWLKTAGRTLQAQQRAELLTKFEHNGLPLYLKLAFEEARLWRSYDQGRVLGTEVHSLLRDNLFARLSNPAEHGELLVNYAMAYLAAARYGLAEDEILDILAANEDYWGAFTRTAYYQPHERRLPFVVWSRLALDLDAYLVRRQADGAALLNFYHRQFSEGVDSLYLAPQREDHHAHLAAYYKQQPLSNLRKLSEQAYQQAKAGQHEAYVATLTDYPFLQASLDARGVDELIEDCGLREDETVSLLESVLSMSAHVLNEDKGQLHHQIRGRLWMHREKPGLVELWAQTGGRGPLELLASQDYPPMSQAGGPLRATLHGHTHGVWGALVLPGGRLLSWSADKTLRLWSADGAVVSELRGHRGEVTGALVLPDGRLLSWSNDNAPRLWSADGAALSELREHTWGVNGVLVLPDGRLLSWGDNTLRLWSVEGVALSELHGHTHWVTGALVLPDGRLLSWSYDNTLRLWSAEGETLSELRGHTGQVTWAIVLPDGRLLSWGDNTLRLWSAEGVAMKELYGHTGVVNGALVLPDGRLLSWSNDNTLRLWTVEGAALSELHGHTHWVTGALVLPDGRLLSWSDDHTLRLWSTEGVALSELHGHTNNVTGALVLPDGRLLSWSDDHTLRLWSADGVAMRELRGHTDRVIGALVLPDNRLLSWSKDHTLRLWTVEESDLNELRGHTHWVDGALVLPDGRLLSWAYDKTLRLWSADGAALSELRGHTRGVRGALVLSDGRLLSWSNDNTLRLWNADGAALSELRGHTDMVYGALVLSDGRLLSLANDNTLRLWSADGAALSELRGHTSPVIGTLVLPDNRLLSWAYDRTLRLWSAGGVALAVLEHMNWGDRDRIIAWGRGYGADLTILFDPVHDKSSPRFGTEDDRLHLYDPQSGLLLATFYADAPIWAIQELGDGRVVYGDKYGRVVFLH